MPIHQYRIFQSSKNHLFFKLSYIRIGTCQGDGLYYKDDTTFVMCSNGYSHQQPCPPGTKTSGSPSYKAGYYYGYTDLCSVNLVDYGLGPEHYAPVGYSQTATKDATKEVQLNVRGGQGNEFFAEKEVVTSYRNCSRSPSRPSAACRCDR